MDISLNRYVDTGNGYISLLKMNVPSLLNIFMFYLCWFGSRPGRCVEPLLQGHWYVGQRDGLPPP
jgi:hypothetical protein